MKKNKLDSKPLKTEIISNRPFCMILHFSKRKKNNRSIVRVSSISDATVHVSFESVLTFALKHRSFPCFSFYFAVKQIYDIVTIPADHMATPSTHKNSTAHAFEDEQESLHTR